ncbi:MAG: hypothetical protein FWK04_26400 [Nostoc sp. GBBB01]|nr:hypothetical protein [Nostoc sp. GBBB01]
MFIDTSTFNKCLSEISIPKSNLPVNIPEIKKIFSDYIQCCSSADMTLRVEFLLKQTSSFITIYEWNCQNIKETLIGIGFTEERALEKIHQRQKNNLELIIAFFTDLYCLKYIDNNYQPYLFRESQFKNQFHNRNFDSSYDDNELKLKFHQELLYFCIEYLQNTKNIQDTNAHLQRLQETIMNKKNIQATELRCQFAEKLEKMSLTLTAAEENANKNNASGALGLTEYIEKLNLKKEKLQNGIFKFLILGDFNRGKSTILNVLLGEKVLPTNIKVCTAMPTVVKYGQDKNVFIYNANNVRVRDLTLDEFRKEYTSSSKTVIEKVKEQFQVVKQNLIAQYFKEYQYAELYYPLPLLQQGIEFIDTPGLNNSPEDDKKSLNYIDKIDAIFFILNATQQLTDKEKEYITQYIKGNIETVFYLINYWDSLEDEDQDDVHEAFTHRFSELLEKDANEVEKMWNETIFKISAKKDSAVRENKNTLEGTTCQKFWDKLNSFLLTKRLPTELYDAFRIYENTCKSVNELVASRLVILDDNLEQVQNKLEKSKPHFEVMKGISKKLKEEVDSKKQTCAETIVNSYQKYFQNVCNNFDNDFHLPELKSLENDECENFRNKLAQEYKNYIQTKCNEWDKNTQPELDKTFDLLKINFGRSIHKYEESKKAVQDILQGKEEEFNLPGNEQNSVIVPPNLPYITTVLVENRGRDLFGGAVVGSLFGGGGGAGLSVGLHAALIAAGSLTPIGWGVIALAGLSGIIGAVVVNNNSKRKQFLKEMKKQLQDSLPNLISSKQLQIIRSRIESQFDVYYSTVSELNDDVIAQESSLNNIINQKKNNEIHYADEKKRLDDLVKSISSQFVELELEFQNYLQDAQHNNYLQDAQQLS